MPDPETPRIGNDNFVNEATLQYLSLRIESEVRQNLMKWVGIPIGGGGALALLAAVFFWVPAQLQSIVSSPAVQKGIESEVETRVTKLVDEKVGPLVDKKVEPLVDSKMESQVSARLAPEVEKYLRGPEGQQAIAAKLPGALEKTFASQAMEKPLHDLVESYLGGAGGRELIARVAKEQLNSPGMNQRMNELINEYLGSGQGRALISKAVDDAMRPTVQRVSMKIRENANRMITALSTVATDPVHEFQKGTISTLQEFLDSSKPAKILQEKRLLVLSIHRRDSARYNMEVTREHTSRLAQRFKELFRYVAIYDDETFLALTSVKAFSDKINAGPELLDLLNTSPQDPKSADSRRTLANWFGPGCLKKLSQESTAGVVLRSPEVWSKPEQFNEEVAVLDSSDKLIGVTSRRLLIAGLLDAK
jgi:hypothetical protein